MHILLINNELVFANSFIPILCFGNFVTNFFEVDHKLIVNCNIN